MIYSDSDSDSYSYYKNINYDKNISSIDKIFGFICNTSIIYIGIDGINIAKLGFDENTRFCHISNNIFLDDTIIIPEYITYALISEDYKTIKLGKNITHLELQCNKVDHISLPDSIIYLRLQSCNIYKIRKIPKNIQLLDLSLNYIYVIDKTIPVTTAKLNLSYNCIGIIKNIHDIQLTHLDLSNNKIKCIPKNSIPETVKYLDLSTNKIRLIKYLPRKLIFLDMSDNVIDEIQVNAIPENIEYLLLDYNTIDNLENIVQCTKLTCLSVIHNNITNIPNITSLPLKILCLKHNNILYIPEGLPNTITFLDLRINNIKNIKNLSQNKNLSTLYLCNNEIKEIPKNSLPENIKILRISSNPLDNICNMPQKIQELDIRYICYRKIGKLPTTLKTIEVSYPSAGEFIWMARFDNIKYLCNQDIYFVIKKYCVDSIFL